MKALNRIPSQLSIPATSVLSPKCSKRGFESADKGVKIPI